MPIPTHMTAIGFASPGGPEVLAPTTLATPSPRGDEVLIHVLAAGVNRPDVMQRKGSYPPPPGASPATSSPSTGEVVARGDGVTGFAVGEAVCALTNGGGYAEYAVAPAAQCLPWPSGYDAVRSAALPENFFTVWANVFTLGRLAAGERLLVHGGTSGIGVTAIQLAVAFDASVIATAGSPDKVAACRRLGAVHAIDYRVEDFAAAVRGLADRQDVDVVLDMVGAPYFARNLACLAMDGRLVQIAFSGGSKAEAVDLLPIMLGRLTVTGSTMRPRTTAQKGAIADELRRRVWPLLDAGRCAPVIHTELPLAEAARAHVLMESGAHVGKIVLRVATA